MFRNIIFDFMGVIADVDYKKMLNSLSFSDKIKALRLFVKYKTSKELKDTFDAYQTGCLDLDFVDYLVTREAPFCKDLVYKLSYALSDSITINKQMVELIKDLKKDDFGIILMSNSTPETESIIKMKGIYDLFDGVILSTELGKRKPDAEIFQYAVDTFKTKPNRTFFIDDTKENIEAAKAFGFYTISCANTKNPAQKVGQYFYSKFNADDYEIEK